MTKRSKPTIEVERYVKLDEVLIASDSFVYEINTFVSKRRSYNLQDSIFIKRTSLRKSHPRVVYRKPNNVLFIQTYKLIAAPKEWLKQNNYTFIT